MSTVSRRTLVAGLALGLAATMVPATAAHAAVDTKNGIHRVWVSNTTVNSTNKQLWFAFGPSTGTAVPAGSTWTVTIEVQEAFRGEGVNLPTTSSPNSTGSWSTPRKVSVDDEGYTTMEVTWTSSRELSSTHVGPTLQWVNSRNPLRPRSLMFVTTTAPDGSNTTQVVAGNQRNGTYYP